ncbi:hypothetical protein IYW40_04695 [Methylocystis sp. H4A]|uniref:hypothetical protein n=1 Tax=Methylocystis sp. H4A TaxID=2785788 RepID=UPI0018C288EC|nr:hypothetical protein [Methylocystis sp. H4A]MBG0800792.1 hypothetical protein [Methylocystis sp. H4A]
MKPDTLLTPSGAYDKAAIMLDAHRQRRQMMRYGWTWSRCLAFSWTKAKAMRARLRADPNKVEKTLVGPTAEGVALLFARLTGRNVSPEDMSQFADELAALEN